MANADRLSDRCDTGFKRPSLAIMICVVAPLAGVALAYLILVHLFLPTIGVGGVQTQRIVDLSHQLDQGLGTDPVAAIIGNSVVVEGVSASQVQQAAPPGWSVWNFSVSGCDVTEQHLILPRLIRAGPEIVVFVFRPIDVGTVGDVDTNKLHAYSLARYAEAFPDDYDPQYLPGLSEESWQILRSSDRDSRVFFRRSPITFLEQIGFSLLRQGRVDLSTGGWDQPSNLTSSISGSRLDRHFRVVIENGLERVPEGESTGAEHIARMVATLNSSGIRSVLVVAPIHPDIPERHQRSYERLLALLDDLSDRYGSITADASDLLRADDFADAIHPNAQGRQRFSTFIGNVLPDPRDLKLMPEKS
jgi:hypothetical protein